MERQLRMSVSKSTFDPYGEGQPSVSHFCDDVLILQAWGRVVIEQNRAIFLGAWSLLKQTLTPAVNS